MIKSPRHEFQVSPDPAPQPAFGVSFLDRRAGHQWAMQPIAGEMAFSIWHLRNGIFLLQIASVSQMAALRWHNTSAEFDVFDLDQHWACEVFGGHTVIFQGEGPEKHLHEACSSNQGTSFHQFLTFSRQEWPVSIRQKIPLNILITSRL
jgi:hypothetical protein